MTDRIRQENRFRGAALIAAVFVCLLVDPSFVAAWEHPVPGGDDVRQLREERRKTARLRAAQKDAEPAKFGLLVVPVEFSDTRFPEGWEANAELGPDLDGNRDATLTNYFRVASRGGLEMEIVLAPVVTLDKERWEYSYIGWANAARSRMMAREALEQVRDWGFEFRRLDLDGPDGLPASGDDDGELDGVLFLHAGPGVEIDPEEGLIPAHQYFLDEPVVDGGVEASFYSVAGYRSGLGIWAHETAHLLGLEDRYDPRLAPDLGSEVRSRGGLGRFSLMASGAWGTGDGESPALPDAYSCLQLGWLAARDLDVTGSDAQILQAGLVSGEAGRIWKDGRIGEEFYVLETRDPAAAAPFDAAVPAGQLIIYHVDESEPEGYLIEDGPGSFHLRVRLVEADADGALEAGLDDGGLTDLFPGSTGKDEFGPYTTPSSYGYRGASQVWIGNISPVADGISFHSSALTEPLVPFEMAFGAGDPAPLELVAEHLGDPVGTMQATVTALGAPVWGEFEGGGLERVVELEKTVDGYWVPRDPVSWSRDIAVPAGAETRFSVRFVADSQEFEAQERTWVWSLDQEVLDFANVWPGDWTVETPGYSTETAWLRWDGAPWLTDDESPVLACVDTDFADGSDWPDVRYNNYGHATLTSGLLPADLDGLRIVHAIEGEMLTAGTALDGGRFVWIGPDGTEIVAEPADGWEAPVDAKAYSALAGEGVLTGADPFLLDGRPVWRTDVIETPRDTAGPWRLRLEFASDASGYRRGWFVAGIEPIIGAPAVSAFAADWDGAALEWSLPYESAASREFRIQIRRSGVDEVWLDLVDRYFSPAGGQPVWTTDAAEIALGSRHDKIDLRIVTQDVVGAMASRPLTIYPDGGPEYVALLGAPWPNPCTLGDGVRFLVNVPDGPDRQLNIYDLRGRLIRSWSLPTGNHFLLWEGKDSAGRRAASGTYFLRLEGSGAAPTRKVVLLH